MATTSRTSPTHSRRVTVMVSTRVFFGLHTHGAGPVTGSVHFWTSGVGKAVTSSTLPVILIIQDPAEAALHLPQQQIPAIVIDCLMTAIG